MIALDTNVLVYAHRAEAPQHAVARRAVEALAAAGEPWAVPWPCVHEFYNIITHPALLPTPTPPEVALAAIDNWFTAPRLMLLHEGPGYWPVLHHLVRAGNVRGPRVHDARIAALCLYHGVRELWTCDRDFRQFSKLKTRNPLRP